MSEHDVASFRVETDDAPLSLDFVTKVSPTASVATEEDFASFECASTLGDQPLVLLRMVSATPTWSLPLPSHQARGCPLAAQLTLDVRMCCLITATTKTKFSMPHTMTLCSLGQCGSAS